MADKKWVLMTGASTGIGADGARALKAAGFDIFAGVRNEKDAAVATERGFSPVILDVTKPPQIEKAVVAVREVLANQGGALHGLVNNAGVAGGGPLEFIPLDDIRWVFEVNVFGLIAVTQAFLPMLRPSKGRIINIGSIAGKVTTPMLTPYCATKHAVESISDGLRRELHDWGLHVVLIEPGSIKTPIWEKGVDTTAEMNAKLSDTGRSLYENRITTLTKVLTKQAEAGAPVDQVSKAIVHAMTSAKPNTRYLVGQDAKMGARAHQWVPDRLIDKGIRKMLRWD